MVARCAKENPMSADEQAARQILLVFAKYNVMIDGTLRRHQFFEVRDSDFQRGIDTAVNKGGIGRHPHDRYRYVLLSAGRAAYSPALTPTVPPPPFSITEAARKDVGRTPPLK